MLLKVVKGVIVGDGFDHGNGSDDLISDYILSWSTTQVLVI